MLHNLLRSLPPEKMWVWPKYISQLVWAYNTSTHRSTGHSPYALMFGVPPRLPVDFLLGADAPEETTTPRNEWIQQHQARLHVTRNLFQKNLEEAAELRQQHFRDGQLVYLKDLHCQGHQKIQDVWSPVLYDMVRVPTEPGGPYTITLADGTGNVQQVYRNEMRAAQLETSLPHSLAKT